MYKKYNYKGVLTSIIRLADSASIPIEPANRDYQAVLKWVADGNTIDEAD